MPVAQLHGGGDDTLKVFAFLETLKNHLGREGGREGGKEGRRWGLG